MHQCREKAPEELTNKIHDIVGKAIKEMTKVDNYFTRGRVGLRVTRRGSKDESNY